MVAEPVFVLPWIFSDVIKSQMPAQNEFKPTPFFFSYLALMLQTLKAADTLCSVVGLQA